MRGTPIVLLAIVLALFAVPGSVASVPLLRIPAGPTLAGDGVVWTQGVGSAISVVLWRPGRRLTVVSRFESDGFLALAGSGSHVIVVRSAAICGEGQPCVAREDALAGPRAGPLRPVIGTRSCTAQYASVPAVDVGGAIAAYAQPRCAPRRILVLDLAHRPVRILFSTSTSAESVRLAGRFLAWPRRGSIVVYDWRVRRVAYRYPAPVNVTDFDVQADGKVAMLSGDARISWFSPAQPRAHLLPFRAAAGAPEVRIAGDQLAFARQVDGDESDLVVAALSGRLTRIAAFVDPDRLTRSYPFHSDVSFDGRRITWASDHVTKHRVVCPPPPSLAPCRTYDTGVRTIWLERLGSAPRPLARLPFDESPPS
jgi:hypothetical protein